MNTFAKPDLRGRLPLGDQQGTGLTNRVMGQMVGTENVTLTEMQLPAHQHQLAVSTTAANLSQATANLIGGGLHYVSATETAFTEAAMETGTIGTIGGNASTQQYDALFSAEFYYVPQWHIPQRAINSRRCYVRCIYR